MINAPAMKNSYLKFSLILLIFFACTGNSDLASWHSFPGETWKRFDNPIIEFDIASPGIFYNMTLIVEYDAALAPDELPVTVIMYTPSGEMRSRNIVLKFNDPENTEVGLIKIPLRKDYAFYEAGSCRFELENRSQYVESKGLKKLGIIIDPS